MSWVCREHGTCIAWHVVALPYYLRIHHTHSPPNPNQVRVQLVEADEHGDTGGADGAAWSGGADAERCTIPHLACGAEYVCRVRAVSAEGAGAWSVPFCCTTVCGPPATPAPPVVLAKTSTTVHTPLG